MKKGCGMGQHQPPMGDYKKFWWYNKACASLFSLYRLGAAGYVIFPNIAEFTADGFDAFNG